MVNGLSQVMPQCMPNEALAAIARDLTEMKSVRRTPLALCVLIEFMIKKLGTGEAHYVVVFVAAVCLWRCYEHAYDGAGICLWPLCAVTIIVDQADIAFNIEHTTGPDAITEMRAALDLFTVLTKQQRRVWCLTPTPWNVLHPDQKH